MERLSFKDFQIVNKWQEVFWGPKYESGESAYLMDVTTGRLYWNESKMVSRNKLFCAAVTTPIYHTAILIVYAACRTLKFVTFAFLWNQNNGVALKDRFAIGALDFFKVISTPFVLIALEVAAIYGVFRPYDGRKLYASFERTLLNEKHFLCPCFQPNPQRHLFGGNIWQRDVF